MGGGQPSSKTTVEEKEVKPLIVQKMAPRSSLYALGVLASNYAARAEEARNQWVSGQPTATDPGKYQADLSRTLNLFNTHVPDPQNPGRYILNPDNPYAAADAARGTKIAEDRDLAKKLKETKSELEKYKDAAIGRTAGEGRMTRPRSLES